MRQVVRSDMAVRRLSPGDIVILDLLEVRMAVVSSGIYTHVCYRVTVSRSTKSACGWLCMRVDGTAAVTSALIGSSRRRNCTRH